MPVKACRLNNKPGYKWGDAGKCYTYTAGNETARKKAYEKAAAQGRAIKAKKK
jgi:hypothetical protein